MKLAELRRTSRRTAPPLWPVCRTRDIARPMVRRSHRRTSPSLDCQRHISNSAYSPNERLRAQLIEQRLGISQIGGVETLGEPIVDFREPRACVLTMTLFREQARQTRCA